LAFESAAGYRSRKSLGWLATGTGLKSYHAWLLVAGGCHVITGEAAKGPAAMASRMKDPDGMYKSHDIWLKQLKLSPETSGPIRRVIITDGWLLGLGQNVIYFLTSYETGKGSGV
jgi:hypothetical protein